MPQQPIDGELLVPGLPILHGMHVHTRPPILHGSVIAIVHERPRKAVIDRRRRHLQEHAMAIHHRGCLAKIAHIAAMNHEEIRESPPPVLRFPPLALAPARLSNEFAQRGVEGLRVGLIARISLAQPHPIPAGPQDAGGLGEGLLEGVAEEEEGVEVAVVVHEDEGGVAAGLADAELLVGDRQGAVGEVSVDGQMVGEHAIPAVLPGAEEDDVEVEEEMPAEEWEILGGEEADRRVARLVEVDHEEEERGRGDARCVVEDVGLPGRGVVVHRADRRRRGGRRRRRRRNGGSARFS